MEQHLRRFVDLYSKSIKENNAAIFAGAGLSMQSGFVNWKNLLRDIASELNLDIDIESDLISVTQYHVNAKGDNRHAINQLLLEEFTKDVEISPNHRILANLPIGVYWTTNYDKLIEETLKQEGKTPDVKITAANLANNKPQRDAIVYKMHGDVDFPENAVITKDDYEGYNEDRQLFTTTLQGDLISKTFLFVGFSFDDPNLGYILSRIRILLGKNNRPHYCFFKKISRSDFNTDQEFNYAEIKQELKLRDLKRYSINALLIDKYDDIFSVLFSIKLKILRSNIFVSGAAKTYSPRTEQEAISFIHKLSYSIAEKGYKIVSGFGLGVGSSVINGALEFHYKTDYRHLDNALVLRPFPHDNDEQNKKDKIEAYRLEMLKSSGVAIFIFGNKEIDGSLVISDGMLEEFRMAKNNNVIPVPVGVTGYAAKHIWEQVMASPLEYYPDNADLLDAINQLNNETLDGDEIITQILKAISILQNYF